LSAVSQVWKNYFDSFINLKKQYYAVSAVYLLYWQGKMRISRVPLQEKFFYQLHIKLVASSKKKKTSPLNKCD